MKQQLKRCAVYTRKSREEGLDMAFNSLDAQREACVAYIWSQSGNGWTLVDKEYSDGGFSGGNTDRPALKELMKDIENGLVDIVVVYKIDRLSRSLFDFADLFTAFDAKGVAFVSVTQQIDTSSSAGRMMLNILMTFAQFEREVIAERIRDKVVASRRKGIWVGGAIPYGYRSVDKKLVQQPDEADQVRRIFERYSEVPSPAAIVKEFNERLDFRSGGEPWDKADINRIIANPIYAGKMPCRGELFDGVHEAIVTPDMWNFVQTLAHANAPKPGCRKRVSTRAVLKGVLRCGHCNCAMMPTFTKKADGRRYVYYQCMMDSKRAIRTCPVGRVPGAEVERVVLEAVGSALRTDAVMELLTGDLGVDEDAAKDALADLTGFWDGLFPAERAHLVGALVERAVIHSGGLDVTLRTTGMKEIAKELVDEERGSKATA